MKIKAKKNPHRVSRILMYADGVYVRSFASIKEARRWELNSQSHWYDSNGELTNPNITLVTAYIEEEDDDC